MISFKRKVPGTKSKDTFLWGSKSLIESGPGPYRGALCLVVAVDEFGDTVDLKYVPRGSSAVHMLATFGPGETYAVGLEDVEAVVVSATVDGSDSLVTCTLVQHR